MGCETKSVCTHAGGEQPAKVLHGSPDPRSDLRLYRHPPECPGPGGLPDDDDTELFVHAVPGGTAIYYLCYPSELSGEVSIIPFESRLDAAAFILGKEDLQLVRLEEPDRHRIRFHFPEFFR